MIKSRAILKILFLTPSPKGEGWGEAIKKQFLELPSKFFFTALFSLTVAQLFSQGTYIPLNTDHYRIMDRMSVQYGKALPVFATSMKPYSRKLVAEYMQSLGKENIIGNKRFNADISYEYVENSEWLQDTVIKSKRPLWKVIYPEPANMFAVNSKGFILKVNPVLHFQLGGQPNSEELKFTNTRGVELRGYIKKKIGFYTYFTDSQQKNMGYVQQAIVDDEAVPGEGYYKDGFKETGVDYFTARGYIVFNVLDCLDFSFGHDKHFWGNGIRSLYLSDYGNNYLFLKMQLNIWKISYTNLFTEMIGTYDRGADQLLPKKYGAFHHLNINATHWLDIGLFEGVIFEREDGFELQYLNPIIFYRAIEQSLGSPDNVLIGLDYKANIARTLQLYGQFVFDEFNLGQIKAANGWWANKIGIQTGMKYIDMFTIDHLDFQAEFNWARPYTYSHNTIGTSYTHYNQALAHPLGANFWELIFKMNYQMLPSLNARATVMYAVKGTDNPGENWGGNIFLPNTDPTTGAFTIMQEYGNEVTQGVKQNIALFDLLISYELRHQLFFDFNMAVRSLTSEEPSQNNTQSYFGVAMRVNIPYRGYWF